ncbi:MAG TPA: malonyl-ACP O-methyltransferase BioC [Casimicrobiaceae bacterium]|nr:malonyl-ACP O-methyltransferase BioC [Casimicrobiaceae bacterium]
MPADPRFEAPDPREVDPRAVRRAFSRSARTYDARAALQREVSGRMAQRLDYVKVSPDMVLDLGCGTGEAIGELAARYPAARIVGLDVAEPMVAAARARTQIGRTLLRRLLRPVLRGPAGLAPWFVCGDANAIPLRGVAFDLVWSNLALQWINDLPRVFGEVRRVMKVGGLFTFTTFGPDTLKELRSAFARADSYTHVSRFVDMHDIGDALVAAGFADPVMDMEMITLTYATPAALLRELKGIGATNATRGRPRGLTGARRWQRVLASLERARRDDRIPATFEVVYGHAWKGEPRRTPEGHAVVQLKRPSQR